MKEEKEISVNIKFRIVIYTVALLLGMYLAYQLKAIVITLFFAFIINAAVRPIIEALENRGFKRGVAILVVYTLIILVFVFFGFVILNEAINQIRQFIETFKANSPNLANIIKTNLPFLQNFVDVDKTVAQLKVLVTQGNQINTLNANDVFSVAVQAINVVGTQGINVIEGVIGGVLSIVIMLVISVYMVAKKDNFHDSLLNLFPANNTKRISDLLMEIQASLGSWLGGQIVLMIIIGVASYIVVVLPKIFDPTYELYKYALIIGILAGILEALPNIGPVLTLLIAVVLAIISGAGLPVIIYIFVMLLILQELEAWIIVPVIMKKAIDLHPVLSILGILIGFELGGPIAALLSIPIIGALQIVILELSDEWKASKLKKSANLSTELPHPVSKQREEPSIVKYLKELFK